MSDPLEGMNAIELACLRSELLENINSRTPSPGVPETLDTVGMNIMRHSLLGRIRERLDGVGSNRVG